jgi:signal peptidase II
MTAVPTSHDVAAPLSRDTAVHLSRYVLFFGIAMGGCAADLATKSWIFAKLGMPGGRTLWLWDGYVGFQTSLNRGALFGLGQGQVWLFASLSFVAAAGILYWLFLAGGVRDGWLTLALGAIMAGILGNLYDRLGLWAPPNMDGVDYHAVRDWILFAYGDWRWPNFNLADSLLVCGATVIVWSAIFPRQVPTAPAEVVGQDR